MPSVESKIGCSRNHFPLRLPAVEIRPPPVPAGGEPNTVRKATPPFNVLDGIIQCRSWMTRIAELVCAQGFAALSVEVPGMPDPTFGYGTVGPL